MLLNAGTTDVDALMRNSVTNPTGYFWQGVAEVLVRTIAPELDDRFRYDAEAGSSARTAIIAMRWTSCRP